MSEANLSVFEAMDEAFQKTKTILFSPFDLNKWLTLGFCAFLASLAQGGGGGGFGGNPFGGGPGGAKQGVDQVSQWIGSHLSLVLTLGCFILVVAVALGVLFLWLGSRGQFMFMDAVARNRAAVSEPWNRFRRLGNSLFVFRLLFGLASLTVLLVFGGAVVLALLPSIRSHHVTAGGVVAIVLGLIVLVPMILALALFQAVLRDFVVPVMARRDLSAVPALKVFAGEILKGRAVEFFLYYLMVFLLGIASAILITLGTCLTCCIAALPYISSVVFLPIFVFFRTLSLSFLSQLGPGWNLYAAPGEGGFPSSQAPEPAPAAAPGEAAAPAAPAPADTVPGTFGPGGGEPGG